LKDFRLHVIDINIIDDRRRRQDAVDTVNQFEDTLRPFIASVKNYTQNPNDSKAKQV
jgi:hypothetical protein